MCFCRPCWCLRSAGVGYASPPLTGKFGFELVVMMGGLPLLFYTLIKQGGRDLSRMILIGVIFRDFIPQPVVAAFAHDRSRRIYRRAGEYVLPDSIPSTASFWA